MFAALLAGVPVVAGCSSSAVFRPSPAVVTTSPATLTVEGDWADVNAALDVALTRCFAAVLTRGDYAEQLPVPGEARKLTAIDFVHDERAARSVVIELALLRGDAGRLTIERLGDGADPVQISLVCEIKGSDTITKEACLVESIASRLEQLRGVDTAPLRWPD
ncbi:MAG: hypothetical protein AAF235_05865 [Planctomycetota bacterium]